MLLSNLILESKQVRHFSQWDLRSLDTYETYGLQTLMQASPSGFYISIYSILNPVYPWLQCLTYIY
jgi:hypothetical protein